MAFEHGEAEEAGAEQEATGGIADGSLGKDIQSRAVVVHADEIAGKEAIAQDTVDLFPIDAAENIIVIHVETKAVDDQAADGEAGIIQDALLAFSGDTADGAVDHPGLEPKTDGGGRVQGSAAAAGIEDEIEGVGKGIELDLAEDDAAVELGKTDAGQVAVGWEEVVLLCTGRPKGRRSDEAKQKE